jgi:biotin carboxyl carrier protein
MMKKNELCSEVTGSVWKIKKQVGEEILEGDFVMILESMKMEIPVIAEEPGVLIELKVSEEDTVAEGQIVAIVESK